MLIYYHFAYNLLTELCEKMKMKNVKYLLIRINVHKILLRGADTYIQIPLLFIIFFTNEHIQ